LKKALVLDCPSLDAKAGSILSEWEQTTTNELLKTAGFQPDKVFVATRSHFKKWGSLFVSGKPFGPLTQLVEMDRQKLWAALEGYDIALTMGQHAMYCLTGEIKIDTYRGTHIDSPFIEGLQVVPTYAPYIYARMNWSERPVVVAAMRKACKRYEDRERRIYIPETVQDLYDFEAEHIRNELVADVETNRACRITEIGFSPTSSVCLYVQLEDRAHNATWSEEDELAVFLWMHKLACRQDLTWIFHNAAYDLTYLDSYGIRPRGHIADTMLRHHAFQPEWEKSLGFLASLHVPTRAWKHLRGKSKKDFNKAGAI
jgi:hypothetical protein